MDFNLPLAASAFGLGVLHAFEPGHGKTLIATTLLNTKRVWRDPLLLAASSAVGHLAGVLIFTALSFLAVNHLFSSEVVEKAPPVIGATILGLGLYYFCREVNHAKAHRAAGECVCCGPQITTSINRIGGIRGISIVGLVAGLVPCPSILALATSTSVLPSLPYALSIALIFGVGVASAMLLLGLSVSHLSRRFDLSGRFLGFSTLAKHAAPLALIVVGIMILGNSLKAHLH